jgi:hypothetical protein
MFSFVGSRRSYIPCNSKDYSTTENTSDITRSFFLWHWFVKWLPAYFVHLGLRLQ